jgi:hypothetical protein
MNVISVGLLAEFGLLGRVFYVLRALATDTSGSVTVTSTDIAVHFGTKQTFHRYLQGLKLLGLVRSWQREGVELRIWMASPRSFLAKNNIDPGTCFKLDPKETNLASIEKHATLATLQDLQNRAAKKINNENREHSFTSDLRDIEETRNLILQNTGKDILTGDNTTILKSIGWIPDSESGSRALGYNPNRCTLIITEGLQAPQISQKTLSEVLNCSESHVKTVLENVARIRLAFWSPEIQQFSGYKKLESHLDYATVRFNREKGQDLVCRLGGNFYFIDGDYEIVRKYRIFKNKKS